MFDEIEGIASRDEQLLKLCDPTDVQAEVLIRGPIEPRHIRGAAFNSNATKVSHEHLFTDQQLIVQGVRQGFFTTRGYFRKSQ